MAGSNDHTRRPTNEIRSSFRGRDRLASRARLGSNVIPIETVDNELLEALKKLGDDILTEPTPQRLLDALRGKKRRPGTR